MNRFFKFLFGIICFALVINGVITGRIGGLGKSGAGGMAIREQNPEYFWITIIALFVAGIALLIKARNPEDK